MSAIQICHIVPAINYAASPTAEIQSSTHKGTKQHKTGGGFPWVGFRLLHTSLERSICLIVDYFSKNLTKIKIMADDWGKLTEEQDTLAANVSKAIKIS